MQQVAKELRDSGTLRQLAATLGAGAVDGTPPGGEPQPDVSPAAAAAAAGPRAETDGGLSDEVALPGSMF
jgi:hypothetical protein